MYLLKSSNNLIFLWIIIIGRLKIKPLLIGLK